MNKDNRNNEQIYGRNDMIMLDQNNKIYGSLGIADNYVMKTEEGTRLVLRNPKFGKFGDVLTEFNIYGMSSQNKTTGKNLLKYPYIETTKTSQGIMFTDNKDGSINVSGTATDTDYYNLYSNMDGKRLTLASGTYKLVAKGRSKCNVFVNNGVTSAQNEGTFTITDGHNDVWCFIQVFKGLAVDETIYPMIQLASITDESYEPYTGGIPSPSPDYPQEIKSVVNPVVKVSNGDGTESQTVQLPYTLNAIPVASGGNVTIDDQQYIADRVVEKDGVFGIERNIREIHTNTKTMNNSEEYPGWNKIEGISDVVYYNEAPVGESRRLTCVSTLTNVFLGQNNKGTNNILYFTKKTIGYSQSELIAKSIDVDMYIRLQDATFEPLAGEEIEQYKKLSTKTPTTIVENNYNTWMKATYKSTESV
nr:MAG TPA: hypothetical protein [Caudoviricetes sp.]